ncbi:hypothetical protein [Paraclostridium bifermentans]|uniref:hypothetical protein n=1 Tax=Paraclostridium bifermentans TaxID=1490 RepID=UPI00359C8391
MKKERKNKWIVLSGTLVLVVVISIIFISYKTNKQKESINIEHNIPTKTTNPQDKQDLTDNNNEPIYDDITVFDEDEVNKRYKEVNKKDLTYEPNMKNLNDYFFEFENGLAYNTEANNHLKAISEKQYAMILQGYSYSKVKKAFTNEEAIEIASSILPDDIKEIKTKEYKDENYIYYTSKKGNFIVLLRNEHIFNDKDESTNINKDKIESITYFKELSK